MKYIISTLIFIVLIGCGNDLNYYVTNNVLEAEIVNIQSETAGKIIYSKLERGLHLEKGEIVIIIDTTLIHQDKQVLLAKLESLLANEKVLKAKYKTLNENYKYFSDQADKWKRLAENQAGPEQRAEDFRHQMDMAALQMN